MDLESAIGKHVEWKMKFRTAISKQEQIDAATLAKDNCCELGRWLHGEAKASFGRLASHAECIKKHASFHVEAAKIASAINAKKYAEAEAMIGAGTSYTQASNAVGVAVIQLKKEAKL